MVEDLEIDDKNVLSYMEKVLEAIKSVIDKNDRIQKVNYLSMTFRILKSFLGKGQLILP